MTLNGRNAPLVEIYKNFGAHQKNFNEGRPILSAVECRPVIVVSRNIRYMCTCIAYYLPCDATQSAVMRLHVVCPSV